MHIRSSKVALVWAIAFFSSLVVFNNLTDYGSNYMFVAHVLQMDTTFPDNQGMWRAIDSPSFIHLLLSSYHPCGDDHRGFVLAGRLASLQSDR